MLHTIYNKYGGVVDDDLEPNLGPVRLLVALLSPADGREIRSVLVDHLDCRDVDVRDGLEQSPDPITSRCTQ